jgi:hypothetical protein
MKLDGTQLEIKNAIVEHLGLVSTADILAIFEQEYRLEVVLETGIRKIVNKTPIISALQKNAR